MQLLCRTSRPPPQIQWTPLLKSRSKHKIQSDQIALESLGGQWQAWLSALPWFILVLLCLITLSYWLKTSATLWSQVPSYAHQKVNTGKDTHNLLWWNLHGQFKNFLFLQIILRAWPKVQWNLCVFPLTLWTLDHTPKEQRSAWIITENRAHQKLSSKQVCAFPFKSLNSNYRVFKEQFP